MKFAFLISNVFGIGGTIRSTLNISSALVQLGHEVEIVSVLRSLDSPKLPVDPRVKIHSLVEMRKDAPDYGGDHPLHQQPPEVFPLEDPSCKHYSKLTDRRLGEYLRRSRADVVVATRPGLVVCLAELGTDRYLRAGQEHVIHDMHSDALRAAQNAAISKLDVFMTVSEADAAIYRSSLPKAAARILCVPNSIPPTRLAPSDGTSKTVVAAGRLIPVKRYDLLVEAWAKVVAERPDWRLRIYGRGPTHDALAAQIDTLGLHSRVNLMGPASPIETEWAKGSIAAVTSRMESFGMTIVEAMHCGVPVVATDCPLGPREIITDGKDGLLVETGNPESIAQGLLKLINDDTLRAEMGRAAREKALAYEPLEIARRFSRVFEELAEKPRTGPLRRLLRGGPRGRAAEGGGKDGSKGLVPAPKPAARATMDCTADADGNLTLRFLPGTAPRGALTLLCRNRADSEQEVRVPVTEDGEAVLRRGDQVLAEGYWDLSVETAGRKPQRIASGLCDNRALMAPTPEVDGLTHWIPYPTVYGNLSLRTWRRPVHAEAGAVLVGADETVVEGRLIGGRILSAAPALLARSRAGTAFDVETRAESSDGVSFRFALPHTSLAAARGGGNEDHWDLWLRYDDTARPVRIGRVQDDIADRRRTHAYPAAETAGARLRPYYSGANDLSVRTEDTGDGE